MEATVGHNGSVGSLLHDSPIGSVLWAWLRSSRWHYCLRLPCDVLLQGLKRYPATVGSLYPLLGEVRFYRIGDFKSTCFDVNHFN
jgi:hypothetical protein